MKKLIFYFLVSAALFACNSNQTATPNDEEAKIALFKENSKVVKTLFDSYVKNDISQFDTLLSDSVKIDPPSISVGILDKASFLQGINTLRSMSTEVNYTDLVFLPAVDSVTFELNGGVRAYAKWIGVGKNGAIVKNKYYGSFQFNSDHKITVIDEYQDMTGIIQAVTAEKK